MLRSNETSTGNRVWPRSEPSNGIWALAEASPARRGRSQGSQGRTATDDFCPSVQFSLKTGLLTHSPPVRFIGRFINVKREGERIILIQIPRSPVFDFGMPDESRCALRARAN
jgi:hypothetical protein